MKQLQNDDSPLPSYVCRQDAKEQHDKFWSTFSTAKQTLALDLKALAHNAYGINGHKVYMNPREKFIAIKVDHPKPSVAWQSPKELAAMHAFVVTNNIEIAATKNNLLFRIKR